MKIEVEMTDLLAAASDCQITGSLDEPLTELDVLDWLATAGSKIDWQDGTVSYVSRIIQERPDLR